MYLSVAEGRMEDRSFWRKSGSFEEELLWNLTIYVPWEEPPPTYQKWGQDSIEPGHFTWACERSLRGWSWENRFQMSYGPIDHRNKLTWCVILYLKHVRPLTPRPKHWKTGNQRQKMRLAGSHEVVGPFFASESNYWHNIFFHTRFGFRRLFSLMVQFSFPSIFVSKAFSSEKNLKL